LDGGTALSGFAAEKTPPRRKAAPVFFIISLLPPEYKARRKFRGRKSVPRHPDRREAARRIRPAAWGKIPFLCRFRRRHTLSRQFWGSGRASFNILPESCFFVQNLC